MARTVWAEAEEKALGKAKRRSVRAKRSVAVVVAIRLGLVQALLRAGVPASVTVGVVKVLAVMELAVQAAVGARLAGGVARMTSLSSGWTRSLSSHRVPAQRGLGCSQSKSAC